MLFANWLLITTFAQWDILLAMAIIFIAYHLGQQSFFIQVLRCLQNWYLHRLPVQKRLEICEGTRVSWKVVFGQMRDDSGIFICPKGR